MLPASVDMSEEWLDREQTSLTALKLGKPSLRTGQGHSNITQSRGRASLESDISGLVLIRYQMPTIRSERLFNLSVPACGPPEASSLGETEPDINTSRPTGPEEGTKSWESPKGEQEGFLEGRAF